MHKGAVRIGKNRPWPRSLQQLGAQELRSFFRDPLSVFITTGTSWGQLAAARKSRFFTSPSGSPFSDFLLRLKWGK